MNVLFSFSFFNTYFTVVVHAQSAAAPRLTARHIPTTTTIRELADLLSQRGVIADPAQVRPPPLQLFNCSVDLYWFPCIKNMSMMFEFEQHIFFKT